MHHNRRWLFCRAINNRQDSRGFTIIGVLVILGVLAIVSVLIGQALINTKAAQQMVTAKVRYRDVEQQMVDVIGYNVDKQLTASGVVTINNLFVNSFLQFPAAHNFSSTSVKLASSITRCQAPNLPASPNSGTELIFCVQAVRDANAPVGSFLASLANMAEVQIDLVDLQTFQPITGAQYQARRKDANDHTAGAMLNIRLFWENKIQGQFRLSTHDISYTINENP